MPRPHVMVLNSGGMRSLVAAALIRAEADNPWITLVHIADGRDAAKPRLEHLDLQAQWLGCKSIRQLRLPHLHHRDQGQSAEGESYSRLTLPQMLLAAISEAQLIKAHRLIYPGSFDGDAAAINRAAEQIDLTQQLAEAEGLTSPVIEAPLLDLSDQQIIELGDQSDAPWHAAWSCLHKLEAPCQSCPACKRRRKAFEAAGVPDTQRHAVAAR